MGDTWRWLVMQWVPRVDGAVGEREDGGYERGLGDVQGGLVAVPAGEAPEA